jgi:hypothetical protein
MTAAVEAARRSSRGKLAVRALAAIKASASKSIVLEHGVDFTSPKAA